MQQIGKFWVENKQNIEINYFSKAQTWALLIYNKF